MAIATHIVPPILNSPAIVSGNLYTHLVIIHTLLSNISLTAIENSQYYFEAKNMEKLNLYNINKKTKITPNQSLLYTYM